MSGCATLTIRLAILRKNRLRPWLPTKRLLTPTDNPIAAATTPSTDIPAREPCTRGRKPASELDACLRLRDLGKISSSYPESCRTWHRQKDLCRNRHRHRLPQRTLELSRRDRSLSAGADPQSGLARREFRTRREKRCAHLQTSRLVRKTVTRQFQHVGRRLLCQPCTRVCLRSGKPRICSYRLPRIAEVRVLDTPVTVSN